MADRDVTLKVKADTKEAKRNLREMERQVDKLGDLADQGERRQDGFLSAKQVQMYKRILREMENAHTAHQRKLEQAERAYEQRKAPVNKLKQLEEELRKRQQLLRNAEGGNKWGDQASPIIQEYHRGKFEQANQALDAYKKSDELKSALTDISSLEADLNVMRAAVARMEAERNRSQPHAERIGNMHQLDPSTRRFVNGAMDTAMSTGAVLGYGAYFNYNMDGIDLLRKQERATNSVALQGGYPVGGQVDGELRRNNYKLGEAQYFDTYDTAIHQKAIIAGGTTGDLDALARDTRATQRFGRSYDIDPTQVAGGGALLQRMGTYKEGEQQRFANMIAGAIAKNGMSGRQEEMLRATVSLAQSVSQGQVEFTRKQFENVAGLQVALGEAVPTLKGERGAQMLATLDQGIKGSGHQADLMMGKGVEFTGIEGMYELDKLQERGLSDPRNLQLLAKHTKRLFGGNKHMEAYAMKEQFGLNLNEYEALDKAGLWDKLAKDPNSVTKQDLEKAGAKELAKQWDTYTNSETAQVDKADSRGRNLKGSHAQVADEGAKFGRNSLWHDLPDPVQHALLVGGGIGVGTIGTMALRRGLTNGIMRRINPNINGQGGWRSALGNARNSVSNWWGNMRGGSGGGTPPTPTPNGSGGLGNRLGGFGGRMTGALSGMGRSVPIVGSLLGVGLDRVANPEHSWGRSIARGVGGAVGGLLGAAGGVALGLGTGGAGLLATGALSMGGGAAGTAVGDKIYSMFAGEETANKVPTTDSPKAENASASVDKIDVNKLNINNKDFASYFDKDSSKKDVSHKEKPKEQVVRIIVEGDIKGMDKENQKEVTDSIKDYFKSSFSYNNNPFKFNLALDQTRT